MYPRILRTSFRARVRQGVRRGIRANHRMVTVQQNFPAVTPEVQQFLTNQVRAHLVILANNWLVDSLQSWWQSADAPQAAHSAAVPEPSGGGSGTSSGGDGRPEMTVEQIIALLENSSQYMVHTTPWPQPGTLREPLYPSYPTGREDENAVRGVYAMRGLSGAPNGKYYVVFADDGRFGPYPNGEFICLRTRYPHEAVGWFTQQQLALAKQDRKKR